jgi:transporter family-2 protein
VTLNQAVFAATAMLAGGAFLALQAPTNAMLARGLGSPVNAALVSFVVGSVALVVVAAALNARPDMASVKGLPWWAWLGGLYGAVLVAGAAYAAPKIGVTSALTLVVAGQFFVAVALDHYGAMGLSQRPVNLSKIAGLLLVAGGVFLVRR